MADDLKKELASGFETAAVLALAERGPVPVKPTSTKPMRLLKVLGKDGKPTGEVVTHAAVLAGAAKAAEFELAVQEGERPKHVLCVDCRKILPVVAHGGIPLRCKHCLKILNRERTRAWRAKHPEENRAREKRNSQDPKRQAYQLEYQRAYRAKKKAEQAMSKRSAA